MTTPILQIVEIANNQVNQYITANEAFRALESASNGVLDVSLASGNVTLTSEQFTRSFCFICAGHTVAASITVPAAARFFAVVNAGSDVLSIVRGTASISVPAGQTQLCITTGAANGLLAAAPAV